MFCNSQWLEGIKIVFVFESNEVEWYDDQEDGFFVDVLFEQEGSIIVQCDSFNKGILCGLIKQFYKRNDLED